MTELKDIGALKTGHFLLASGRHSDVYLEKFDLLRNTVFPEGSRVLVLDDILTTGGSVRETLVALEVHPVVVVGIGVLVDRSGGAVTFGEAPLRPLAQQNVESWEPADCPMCQRDEPLVKPGTTVTQPAS